MANRNSSLPAKAIVWVFFSLCLAFSLETDIFSQNGLIAEKYSKIIPGVSTRDDVERAFPKAMTGEYSGEDIVRFRDNELGISIEYSTGRCGHSLPDYGTFPIWTVIAISYDWPNDNQVPLEAVIIDLRQFKRVQKSDAIIFDNYLNSENGINVVYDTKRNSVDGIYLEPSIRLRMKFGKCP